MNKTALLCESEAEREEKQCLNSIRSLAKELNVPEEDVKQYYEVVLKRYKKIARIRVYLQILVRKEVKEVFLERKRSKSLYGIINPLRSEK